MATIHGYLTAKGGWAHLGWVHALRKLEEKNGNGSDISILTESNISCFGPHLNNDILASIHIQKCPCGSCEIQKQMPTDTGWVLPPHVSGTRHITFSVGCGRWSGLWMGSSHSWLQSGKLNVLDDHPWPREPLWKPRFPEKFQHTTGPTTSSLDALNRVRRIAWLYPHHTAPCTCPLKQLKTNRDNLRFDFSQGGKWEHVSKHPVS